MGSEAKIDMRPSSVWLREKTAKWPWKTHLRVGAKRDEALEILSSEGTLLVLCSLVDNMPYVVAEAAVSLQHETWLIPSAVNAFCLSDQDLASLSLVTVECPCMNCPYHKFTTSQYCLPEQNVLDVLLAGVLLARHAYHGEASHAALRF